MSGDVGADVAAALAAHQIEGGKGFAGSFFGCTCDGWLNDSDHTHAEHVAALLAPLIAARVEAAQAEAWDKGWAKRAEYSERRDVPLDWPDLNPYRAAALDPEATS